MTDDDTQRLIGALEAQNKELNRALIQMHDDMRGLRSEVQSIDRKLAGMEGGRKALWGLILGAAAIGGAASSVLAMFLPK